MIRTATTCLLILLVCCVSTIATCLIGAAYVESWSLSEANFWFTLFVGAFLGATGSVVVIVTAFSVDSKILLAVSIIGTLIVAVASGFAFYFWCATIAAC